MMRRKCAPFLMIGSVVLQPDKKNIASSLAAYQPPAAVRDLTVLIKQAYQDGVNIQEQPFEEFNGKSLIGRMNEDQKAWLSWNPQPYGGDDDWRWHGVRPITRNKVISTAAHLTSQLLYPNIFAQNEFDEEDRDAAYVMRELIEYNIRRSNYETAFLFGVISGLVNPVTYFQVDYCEGWQDVWQNGKKEEVIDEVFSGFQNALIPAEEILIGNPYQFELKKQDWIIHKKRISYGEAEAKYASYDNFTYVKPGIIIFLHEDGLFYEVEDVNDDMVEEVCYKHRRSDTEIYFLNGIYLGNENTEFNPFYHRTHKNRPEYNIVKFGAEPIDAMRFYFYKSLVAKMSNDQELIDREYQMYMDANFLATFPPIITMGVGKIDKSVHMPATVTDLGKNTDAKVEPLQIADPTAALNALREAERSVVETTMDAQLQGVQEGPEKTARESVLLQQNANTTLGLLGKMIGTMVKEIGQLYVHDIIRYQSIGQAGEIAGEMAYKTFILDGKVKEGKDKSTYIKFTDRFAGRSMSAEEKDMEEYGMMEDAGDNKEIYEVNPALFARMDYLITIDADKLLQKNDAFERAFKLEIYDRALANPLVQMDMEAMQKITRDFLFEPLMKGQASQYLPQIQKVANSLIPPTEPAESPPGPTKPGMPSRLVQSVAMEGRYS